MTFKLKIIEQHLHIVCLDVPYPPDYGGVFDLFYKIKALFEEGVKIHLHCFEYGRKKQDELMKYCIEVNYYPRKPKLTSVSVRLPYIVISRKNKDLISNLLKDDYPVLLEGIHCTYHLYRDQLKNRPVFVRLHNVEFKYYARLAISETAVLRKLYYTMESRLLHSYERILAKKATIFAVSRKDAGIYIDQLGAEHIDYMPVFLPWSTVRSMPGKGAYCLYQGNLSVAENEKAASWLIENVFCDLNMPLIIAGKSPSKQLRSLCLGKSNITVKADPSALEMEELISHAQVNVLPSFNSTGIKVKLLQALFAGRHCVVNPAAVDGTGLEYICHVAPDAETFARVVKGLFEVPFEQSAIEARKLVVEKEFDNKENAKQLIRWMF